MAAATAARSLTMKSARETPEDVYAAFLARREGGEAVSFEAILAERPGMAGALRRLAAEQEALANALGLPPLRESSTFFREHGRPVELEGITFAGAPLEPGNRIAGYQLLRPLGQGGMGQVWEAWQASVDRSVALKFIRADHVTPDAVQRFRTEARAGGRLNHPGIVSVLDAGCQDGRHWIAQELVDGGCTLRDVLADLRESGVPPDYDRHVAELFCQIADALQTAHDAGVLHRDLKPQNILVTRDDRPKVGDFGLARLVGEETLSRTGLAGTPCYMSPEQASEKARQLDARSDVFSLGAVLYEMLTLRRPFDGQTSVQVLARILHAEPADPRELRPEVPRDLAVIAMGALEKRREERYQSMSDLAADLRRFLRNEPILRQPPTALERALKWTRRHPTRTAVAGLGLVLLVAVAGLGRTALEQRSLARTAEKERGYVEGRWAFDRGDLAQGVAAIRGALELDPTDPLGHVYLAFGYFDFAHVADAEREIALAEERGFGLAPPAGDAPAEDHLAYGMFRLVRDKSAGYDVAEDELARALELDPRLEGAMRPLFQLRRHRGDREGAREVLEEWLARIPSGDDLHVVAEGLLLELDGDPAAAVERLQALSGRPQEELLGLRWYREMARSQLKAGLLDGALENLAVQVAARPDDGPAWELIARAHTLRFDQAWSQGAGPAELLPELEAAQRAAAKASLWDPGRPEPYRDRAAIALARLRLRGDRYAPIPSDLGQEVRERLEELREVAPDHPDLAALESDWLLEQALESFGAGRTDEAIDLLEQCIERYDENLIATVLLAEKRFDAGDDADCLDLMERVIAVWDPDRWRNKWLLAAHVWALGAADRLGQLERAQEALGGAEDVLAGGVEDAAAELITLAEFLATARTSGVRDCRRAAELVREHDLEHAFEGNAEAEAILERIRSACP